MFEIDIRQKLRMYDLNKAKWERVVYRPADTGVIERRTTSKKPMSLYTDYEIFNQMMDAVSHSTIKIALEIIRSCSYGTNYYSATYDEIEEVCHLGRGTVIRGMKELQAVDFIRKVRNSKWMLNPAIGTKCDKKDEDGMRDQFFRLKAYDEKEKGD